VIRLSATIALKHLLARRRQSLVSLLGIVLGVAFFLSISAMMQGSENDFIKRLVDNSPHITISDEFRNPSVQPAVQAHANGAVEVSRVKPLTETRGVRGFQQVLDYLRTLPGLRASPLLIGQALVTFAGKDVAITLNGVLPAEYGDVSTIENYMVRGSLDDLIANPNGIVIGDELARVLSLQMDGNLSVAATTGQVRTFKIVGIFHTGRANVDKGQAFVTLKRVQALLDRPNRANNIVVKLVDPNSARTVAERIESHIGYKAVSWQEQSEDLMSTLALRRIIMYTVVGAVLLVAAFGIYNVISTVVMEKQRDIAILKSMGFRARDVEHIFVVQGVLLGLVGDAFGLLLGSALMFGLMQIRFKFPGSTDYIYMSIDWGWPQFAIAAGIAMSASVFAALLPAHKAARVEPVEILRGGA
jgi:lipoprotein-releasing system permease protein